MYIFWLDFYTLQETKHGVIIWLRIPEYKIKNQGKNYLACLKIRWLYANKQWRRKWESLEVTVRFTPVRNSSSACIRRSCHPSPVPSARASVHPIICWSGKMFQILDRHSHVPSCKYLSHSCAHVSVS